jgi:hypothetical protein
VALSDLGREKSINFSVFRSAFFFFCADERPDVRAVHPEWSVAEVAKELGKRWEKMTNKSKFEAQAEADKARYAKVDSSRQKFSL